MDLTRFNDLEIHITRLIQAFERVKIERNDLAQQVHHLQHLVSSQQQDLKRLQRERDEWLQLRDRMDILQQERETIQQKLRHMLKTIEWIEERTRSEADTQSPSPATD